MEELIKKIKELNNPKDYNEAITNLKHIARLLVISKVEVTPEILSEMLNLSEALQISFEIVVDEHKNMIKSNKIERIFKDSKMISLIKYRELFMKDNAN